MSEYDFSYQLPNDFKKRVAQLFLQMDRQDLMESFETCTYEVELLDFAYYEGMPGNNWNKRAIDFSVEGLGKDIELIKSNTTICKKVFEKALQPAKSGLLIKDLYFFETDALSKKETVEEDFFTESIDLENCELVSHGGYGDVYKYHNEHLDMDFALKVYSPIYAIETDQYDGERRFFREAKMLFSLFHEGIVRVYDAGRIKGNPYIKMEYISGDTLTAFHEKKGNLSFKDTLPIIIKIVSAIDYAHKNKVLHRDLKPDNILIERESQRIVVIDFGISAFFDIGRHTQLTKAGEAIAGSTYTDPFLIDHPDSRDPRSDVYSIGAIWYYLLCGRSPVGSDIETTLRFSQRDITDDQVSIVMKCIRSAPKDRYDSCDALMEEINPKLKGLVSSEITINGLCANALTDDEKIVLYFILIKKKRKIFKREIRNWLNENEIYEIDIDNAFDLLSTIGGRAIKSNEQEELFLEIDIDLFRECISNAVAYKDLLQEYVNNHIILAADTFIKVCDSFDTVEWLFISYIVDRKMYSFGDRWMSKMQIEDIKQWESENSMDSSLSENYGRCLETFKVYNFVFDSEWTSEGNTRQYSLCTSLKKLFASNDESIKKNMRVAKDAHYIGIPF